jgi:hypothetical protein
MLEMLNPMTAADTVSRGARSCRSAHSSLALWLADFVGVQLPLGARAVLGDDAELSASAACAFANELLRSLRRRAKTLLGLGSVSQALPDAAVAIERTDSALRLNVHLHVLALDGAYVRRARRRSGVTGVSAHQNPFCSPGDQVSAPLCALVTSPISGRLNVAPHHCSFSSFIWTWRSL